LDFDFARIQATSDLLPFDIIGISIYNKKTGEFEFCLGPIFNNIVLVDEINRTTPKTQSALLETMGEKQLTIEGKIYKLPPAFFCYCNSESYFEKEETAILPIKPDKRGLQNLKEIYIASVFPFNFFIRWKEISKSFSYLVFPEPKKCNLFSYQDRKNKGESK